MTLSPKRILLKLSGETLQGRESYGIDPSHVEKLAETLTNIQKQGFELAIVVGGGNIFRGLNLNAKGMARTPADHMGMLATLINGISLQQALLKNHTECVLMSALSCPTVAENYNWEKANDHLSHGKVVIFVGGTGNPYFTTDTAAALRASEIQADILLKATKVDGVYTKDPLKNKDAVKYAQISYSEYLSKELKVMDSTSIALCMNNKLPIYVFNMRNLGTKPLKQILLDTNCGTLIH